MLGKDVLLPLEELLENEREVIELRIPLQKAIQMLFSQSDELRGFETGFAVQILQSQNDFAFGFGEGDVLFIPVAAHARKHIKMLEQIVDLAFQRKILLQFAFLFQQAFVSAHFRAFLLQQGEVFFKGLLTRIDAAQIPNGGFHFVPPRWKKSSRSLEERKEKSKRSTSFVTVQKGDDDLNRKAHDEDEPKVFPWDDEELKMDAEGK